MLGDRRLHLQPLDSFFVRADSVADTDNDPVGELHGLVLSTDLFDDVSVVGVAAGDLAQVGERAHFDLLGLGP